MTWKRVVYSAHASSRMLTRRITRAMVRNTLVAGDDCETLSRADAPRRRCRARAFGTSVLRVVYVEDALTLTIITVMWVN